MLRLNDRVAVAAKFYGGVDIADGAMAVIFAGTGLIIIERRGRRC